MGRYYVPRFEREKDYKRKKTQRRLTQLSGTLALGAGAAQLPSAAAGANRLAQKNKKTAAAAKALNLARAGKNAAKYRTVSGTLAATAGATGALGSLNWSRQLKQDIKREEKKLGIKPDD